MQKPQCGMRWLFDYFTRFVNIFLCCFFWKQASKDHLTQGNLFKTTLLHEKQSNLENEIYGDISLYSQYFLTGGGSNVHKTYFPKTNEKVFYFLGSKKLDIK